MGREEFAVRLAGLGRCGADETKQNNEARAKTRASFVFIVGEPGLAPPASAVC